MIKRSTTASWHKGKVQEELFPWSRGMMQMPFLATLTLQLSPLAEVVAAATVLSRHVSGSGYGRLTARAQASVYLFNEGLKDAGKKGRRMKRGGSKREGGQAVMWESTRLLFGEGAQM